MKKPKLLVAAALALATLCFTGCASRIIDSASTQLHVKAGDKEVSVKLPKELDAKIFKLTVNPETGVYSLTADSITSSSQGVIDRAGAAQSEALAELSKTLRVLAPLIPIAAPPAIAPAEPK